MVEVWLQTLKLENRANAIEVNVKEMTGFKVLRTVKLLTRFRLFLIRACHRAGYRLMSVKGVKPQSHTPNQNPQTALM